jgi:hypothetical protein
LRGKDPEVVGSIQRQPSKLRIVGIGQRDERRRPVREAPGSHRRGAHHVEVVGEDDDGPGGEIRIECPHGCG